MHPSKKKSWIILLTLVILIKVVSFFPDLIENYYSGGFYPIIAKCQRFLLGWIPVSVGDLLYLVLVIWIVRAIVLFIKRLRSRRPGRSAVWRTMAKTIVVAALWVYLCFNICWGLNYNRRPVSAQFNLEMGIYTSQELEKLVLLLRDSLNALDESGHKRGAVLGAHQKIFEEAAASYRKLAPHFSQLEYHLPSVKPSLFGYLCNYAGVSGYYNPFTGEAQVNTTIPSFTQPFVSCHEIGHQLGYGKEDEANFAGFLSASRANDPVFRYSAYFDMYAYAWRELRRRDSLSAGALHEGLRQGIKEDMLTVKRFYERYEGPVDYFITLLYSQFLKANEQPEGIRRYNGVVNMLMAYYRKKGMI